MIDRGARLVETVRLGPTDRVPGCELGSTARLGDERADRAWRCRDLRAAGVPVVLGSDWSAAGQTGGITAGTRADLTAFTVDPLRADPDELADAPIAMTVVAGTVVHRGAAGD
jgi:predicted amidohydrolase YtcJ